MGATTTVIDTVGTTGTVRPVDTGLTNDDRTKVIDAAKAVPDAKAVTAAETDGIKTDTFKGDPTVGPTYEQAKAGTHVFMRGHKGEGVTQLQERLTELGYLDASKDPKQAADGIFGGQTEAAVRRFQKDNGLTVDGMAGKNTLGKIDELIAERAKEEPKAVTEAPAAPVAPKPDEAPQVDTTPPPPPQVDTAPPAAPVAPAAPAAPPAAPAKPEVELQAPKALQEEYREVLVKSWKGGSAGDAARAALPGIKERMTQEALRGEFGKLETRRDELRAAIDADPGNYRLNIHRENEIKELERQMAEYLPTE